MTDEPLRLMSGEWPMDLGSACFMLMAAIDQKGGNPRYPHGGDAVSHALWHMAQKMAERERHDAPSPSP